MPLTFQVSALTARPQRLTVQSYVDYSIQVIQVQLPIQPSKYFYFYLIIMLWKLIVIYFEEKREIYIYNF